VAVGAEPFYGTAVDIDLGVGQIARSLAMQVASSTTLANCPRSYKTEFIYLADCCATVWSDYLLERQSLEATKLAAHGMQAPADATPGSVAGRHMNSRLGWGHPAALLTRGHLLWGDHDLLVPDFPSAELARQALSGLFSLSPSRFPSWFLAVINIDQSAQ
jgi:hypothetical protein